MTDEEGKAPGASRFALLPTRWVRHPELTPTDKAVLAVLATYASTDRFCYPAIRTLGSQLAVSERTVQYSLRRLEEIGAVLVERRKREDGSFTSNGYWITGYDYLHEQVQPIAPAPVQPIAPKQYQVEQDQLTATSTPTTTRARGLFANVPPGLPDAYRLAYEALRETAKNPVAYDATLGAALEGMHGKAWSAEDVGQALLDLWANGEGWNSGLFRAYLQKHARAQERNAALDAQQAANPTGQTKSPKRFRYTLTDEQRAAAIAQWEAEDRAAAEAAQAKAVANA